MKRFLIAAAALSLLAGTAGSAIAQPRHDNRNNNRHANNYRAHPDWRAGHRMSRNDWRRGSRVDWHQRHLRQPPRGYEWREVDGNYVMAAVATGLIASIILANH